MKRPLHQRIRDDLVAQISSGQLKPHSRIPFEHELMQAYGCARMTVNRAITSMVQDGLIERRKRAGSFVLAPPMAATLMDIPDIEDEVLGRGDTYRFEILEQQYHRARSEPEIELAGHDGDVLAIKGIHFADDRPLALEERLINTKAVPEIKCADFSRQSPGHWLLNQIIWSRVENQIWAETASADIARYLDLDRGAACLILERRTWRGLEPITYVKQSFNAKSYRLNANFKS